MSGSGDKRKRASQNIGLYYSEGFPGYTGPPSSTALSSHAGASSSNARQSTSHTGSSSLARPSSSNVGSSSNTTSSSQKAPGSESVPSSQTDGDSGMNLDQDKTPDPGPESNNALELVAHIALLTTKSPKLDDPVVQTADHDELDIAASLAREIVLLRAYMISSMYADNVIARDRERATAAAKLHIRYRIEHQPESQRLFLMEIESARLRFLEVLSDLELTSSWNRTIEADDKKRAQRGPFTGP